MHTAIVVGIIMLMIAWPEIRAYLYSRKTPEQKYALWRKARADFNHQNGIVDELQYDYMHNTTDGRQQD